MGKEWGFLISELWLLLALAGLVGMFAGWIIWGGRQKVEAKLAESRAEAERLRKEAAAKDAQLAKLKEAAAPAKAKPAPARRKAAATLPVLGVKRLSKGAVIRGTAPQARRPEWRGRPCRRPLWAAPVWPSDSSHKCQNGYSGPCPPQTAAETAPP